MSRPGELMMFARAKLPPSTDWTHLSQSVYVAYARA